MSEQHKDTSMHEPQTNPFPDKQLIELTEDELHTLALEASSNTHEDIIVPEVALHQYAGIDIDDEVMLYLYEISKIPLLTAEQELALAQQIAFGKLPDARTEEQDQGLQAKKALVQANTRLVVSIAKYRVGHGVPFLDLIQEGNLGLMKAADKFDWEMGFRFTTYATFWIKQYVDRALPNQSSAIRVPVHVVDRIRKINAEKRTLRNELGRDPTNDELAQALQIPVDKLDLYAESSRTILSLDTPNIEDGDDLGESIPSHTDVERIAEQTILTKDINRVLASLSPRQAGILQMRYGLGDFDHEHTLEEVGKRFGVTRERIRQIQGRALQILPDPENAQLLEDYLD